MKYSQGQEGCQPTRRCLVDEWWRSTRQLVWPATCVLCRQAGREAIDLCLPCEMDLLANRFACRTCAEPLPASAAARVCGACLRHSLPFAASYAPFLYGYPLDHLIRALKFRGELACARVLGELFARRLLSERNETLPDAIVPVPLAPRRYRTRGYNQAVELSLWISKAIRVPVRADLIERRRETLEQTALDQKQRRKNVRGAFAVVDRAVPPRIAIFDDVITTGSTVCEIAAVLRRAGAEHIEVWAIARAGRSAAKAAPFASDVEKVQGWAFSTNVPAQRKPRRRSRLT